MLLDPELVAYSDWRMPRGTVDAEQLLSLLIHRRRSRFNDNVAIGVLNAAHARGQCPRDLSVIGSTIRGATSSRRP